MRKRQTNTFKAEKSEQKNRNHPNASGTHLARFVCLVEHGYSTTHPQNWSPSILPPAHHKPKTKANTISYQTPFRQRSKKQKNDRRGQMGKRNAQRKSVSKITVRRKMDGFHFVAKCHWRCPGPSPGSHAPDRRNNLANGDDDCG